MQYHFMKTLGGDDMPEKAILSEKFEAEVMIFGEQLYIRKNQDYDTQ